MKKNALIKMTFSVLLTICMLASSFVLPAEAEETKFQYVSLGASNTNGYGMRGYILEEELNAILSGQVSKDDVNVYGYLREPEGAYPDLIRDYLGTKYGEDNVDLTQLAISSMRVEELRVLLDNSYNGDDYTGWRFTGSDGWFNSAEEGGIEELRKNYQNSIKNADLVTVDIGWNNFGVYICNQLVDYMKNGQLRWSTDLKNIFTTEEELAAAEEAKVLIGNYVSENISDEDTAKAITDVFAYSYLGYTYNFDVCMDIIRELNPDATVVVIGIQNLLYGADVTLGTEEVVELGDIFGNFVNMANYYISACSPYESEYLYVKAGKNEHVTLFLDFMRSYDGDAKNLNQNVKDCFDYYDNSLFLQTRVDMMAAQLLEQEYGDYFSIIGIESGEDGVKKGKAGELPTDIMGINVQETFDGMYWPALYAAYDTMAVFVKDVEAIMPLEASGLLGGLDLGAIEDELVKNIEDELVENAVAAANGEAYTVDTDKILNDNDPAYETTASIYVRYYMGNSFFAHPNETGHVEIKDAVVDITNNPDKEKVQALDEKFVNTVEDIVKLFEDEPEQPEQPENPDAPKVEFSDVAKDAWYHNAVQWAVENEITVGYEDGTFRPEASSTRAHVVMFLWNKMGKPEPKTTENTFPDVAKDAWYYDAVLWAAENGITAGYEDGTFRPEAICTRAHVIMFLWNMAGNTEPEMTESSFPDVAEDAWYHDAVLWAVEEEVVAGYEDGTFRPEKECTRAEIVQILYNIYLNTEEDR